MVSGCEMGTEIHWEETKWAAESEKKWEEKLADLAVAPLLKNKESPELMGVYELRIK